VALAGEKESRALGWRPSAKYSRFGTQPNPLCFPGLRLFRSTQTDAPRQRPVKGGSDSGSGI